MQVEYFIFSVEKQNPIYFCTTREKKEEVNCLRLGNQYIDFNSKPIVVDAENMPIAAAAAAAARIQTRMPNEK